MIQLMKGAGITGKFECIGKKGPDFWQCISTGRRKLPGEWWNLNKEPGSEIWPGRSWAGGKTAKKLSGKWGREKFLLFPHNFAARENCWFNNSCSLKSIEEASFVSWNTFWFCRQIMYFLNRSNPTSNLFVAAFCLLIHWSIIPLTGLFCFVLFISEEFITLFKLNAWKWLVGFFFPWNNFLPSKSYFF